MTKEKSKNLIKKVRKEKNTKCLCGKNKCEDGFFCLNKSFVTPINNTTEIKEELVVDTSIIEKQYYDMGYVAGVSKTRENYNITIILVTLAILTVLAIYVSIK